MTDFLSVQEYAELKGISVRAVQKAIANGKIPVKQVPHPFRKDQSSYLVDVSEMSGELANWRTDEPSGELANWRTDEPSGELTNQSFDEPIDEPIDEPQNQNGELTNQSFDEPIDEPGQVLTNHSDPVPSPPTPADPVGQRSSHRTFTPDLAGSNPARVATPHSKLSAQDKLPEAQLFAQFLQALDARLDASSCKTAEWKAIVEAYNARRLVPELHRLKGRRSERALRLWHHKWHASGRDMFALVHQSATAVHPRKITRFEQDYLLARLLTDKKPTIGSVIQDLKSQSRLGLCESPTSIPTLKRWVADWAAANPDLWAQARQGSKFVKDNIVKSIMRDTSMLKVGDVLVADGHTLAFDVINPITGKPARLTLILLYDWASRYPLGAALAATESSQHVLAAVRNAILHLGMLPRFIYFDNGKAFRSQLFHAKWEDHDLALEFAGIFPRLGIEAKFAEAYNARSKVIERFFRTMQEQFERFQSTFRGRNIDDKPANLSRNEKWAQKMFAGKPLEYDEALDLTYYYFRHIYGMRPHSALSGALPFEVFASRQHDPARLIQQERLDFLMLTAERKHLRSEGIWLNKCRYWHEAMVKHIGQPVIIRYDYADLRWILVYDARGEFVCQAEIREAQHGFVYIERDNPLAHQKLDAELRHQRKLLRRIASDTAEVAKASQRGVASELAKHREVKQDIMDQIADSNPVFRQAPMIAPLPPAASSRGELDRLASLARSAELDSSPSDPQGRVIAVAPEPTPDPEAVPSPQTLSNILRRRGIK